MFKYSWFIFNLFLFEMEVRDTKKPILLMIQGNTWKMIHVHFLQHLCKIFSVWLKLFYLNIEKAERSVFGCDELESVMC